MIYDYKYSYRFSCNTLFPSINGAKFLSKQRHYIGYVPFSEWKINSARIGIVEVVESILDAANMISSNEVDNVIDYVNSILLVYNQKNFKTINGRCIRKQSNAVKYYRSITTPQTLNI